MAHLRHLTRRLATLGLATICGIAATIAALIAPPALAQGERLPPPISDTSGLQVTFLVYSGLPNPTITLTDPAQVADLQARIAQVETSGARLEGFAAEPVLGYNGIVIEDLATVEEDDGLYYVVHGDVLSLEGATLEDSTGARPALATTGATEIENLLVDLGIATGALDSSTLFLIRGGR